MYLHSTPAGVNVAVFDAKGKEVYVGQTPSNIILKSGGGYFKKARYDVKFTALGYADQTIPIEFKLNGWYFGNILIGGIIGMLIVDPATGAMWKPKDVLVDATMEKSNNTASSSSSLQIIDINSLSANEKANLVRIK